MREVINVHIGQAGVQIGGACWELYCLEHGIHPDGYTPSDKTLGAEEDCFASFFEEHGAGKYVPRAVFVDTDASAVDDIRSGAYRQLFHPEQLLSGKEDCAGNFAKGYCTTGKEIVDLVLDRVRKLADNCSGLQGFIVHRSLGGGTGAGLGSLLMERLSVDYGRKTKLEMQAFPSVTLSSSVVDSYNAVLAGHRSLEHADCSFLFDNEALTDICHRVLDIQRCGYANMNRVVAQMAASLTTSLRFDGALNVDLAEFQTNLVPYPRVHFCSMGYGPLLGIGQDPVGRTSTYDVSMSCIDPAHFSIRSDIRRGQLMSCCLTYRGDIVPKDVGQRLIFDFKRTLSFVDWCPTGFKCGINYQPPVMFPDGDLQKAQRSCLLVCNSTAIAEVWRRSEVQFDRLFAKRAFVHWFVQEGADESELVEAREDIASLQKDYEEIVMETQIDNNEEM